MDHPFKLYNASAGSGKTYALARAYLEIVLRQKGAFGRILAITFTNKAVNEMKHRIVNSLHEFGREDAPRDKDPMFRELAAKLGLSAPALRALCRERLKELLHNYAFFDVCTIDKFTHRLVRTFAKDLKISQTFEVVLNKDLLLDEAVGRVVAKAGEDRELTSILLDFALEKTEDDRSWDIGFDLVGIGQILFKEDYHHHLHLLEKRETTDFLVLKEQLLERMRRLGAQCVETAKGVVAYLADNGLEEADFSRGTLPKHFTKVLRGDLDVRALYANTLQEQLATGKFFNGKAKHDAAEHGDYLLKAYLEIKEKLHQYDFLKNVRANLVPLGLLRNIQKELKGLQEERDQMLISEFNAIISEEIKNQPAPFIYERLGEKYRHYFMDEFQDTSSMQWQNLVPLIASALESQDMQGRQGSLFLVGDAKQAIYRWRGGKAEQFLDLANKKEHPFSVAAQVNVLPRNYRSHAEIVHFNNAFFQSASQFLNRPDYEAFYKEGNAQEANAKDGGYVSLTFLEDDGDEAYIAKTVNIIHEALREGHAHSDICVLTRKKAHGKALANGLMEANIPVVSPDSLTLAGNPKVAFLVNLATYALQPNARDVAFELAYFLCKDVKDKHLFVQAVLQDPESHLRAHFGFSLRKFKGSHVYDAMEYAIKAFDLAPASDAHLTTFMDLVLDVYIKKGGDLQSFLAIWEKKGNEKNISAPENMDAVSVMTIHKSKGLEFPIVIFPYANTPLKEERGPKMWLPVKAEHFNGFSEVMINKRKTVLEYSELARDRYCREDEKLQLDSMNVLYVAMTRAEMALYVISPKDTDNKGNYKTEGYAGLLMHYLDSIGQWQPERDTYTFGELPKGKGGTQNIGGQTHPEGIPYIYTQKDRPGFRVMTRAGMLWDNGRDKALDRGNLLHALFGRVKTAKDLAKVVADAVTQGSLAEEEARDVGQLMAQVMDHPDLAHLYQEGNTVWNERELFIPNGQNLRPDRVVLVQGAVTIVDYKTGKPQEIYAQQLKRYANAYKEMGFVVAQKIIVYLSDKITVEQIQ
ncbi:UvrD-helicase domain-containing protein [Maribacter sp. 2307ULW6-5]|uniref:UvrD-helicase domain-containing protein n=1 Tax=Maribacter sp. 2307ULW6-5 TaxID=3386275 RepID=UPI0039BC76D7